MKIALVQLNPTVGDLAGNAAAIVAHARRAHDEGARVAFFAELAVTGYGPRDLLERPAFLDAVEATCAELARAQIGRAHV